jgi:hypothetical protein
MGVIDTTANIALCNQALGLLGAGSITINVEDQNHTYCEMFFADARDEILTAHKWNFAKKRAFAIQTTAPLFGYDNAFTKPSDCLKVWMIEQDPLAKFEVEGGLILTDEGGTPVAWAIDTYYKAGDIVTNDGTTFQCLVAHYSNHPLGTVASIYEPGVGTSTDTYWKNFVVTAGTIPTAWAAGVVTAIGAFILNDTVIYECIKAHTTAALDDEPGVGAVYANYWRVPAQNQSYIEAEYVYQATDVSDYPIYLRQCVILNLARMLCSPIKQEPKTAMSLQQMLYGGPGIRGYMDIARSLDAQEGGGQVITTNDWLNSRR